MASNLPGGVSVTKRVDGATGSPAVNVRILGVNDGGTVDPITSSQISAIGTPVLTTALAKDGLQVVERATTKVDGVIQSFAETPDGTAFAETPTTQSSGNPIALVTPVDRNTVLQVQTYSTTTQISEMDVGKFANFVYPSALPRAYLDQSSLSAVSASGAVQIVGLSQIPGNEVPAASGVGALFDVVPVTVNP